MWLLRHISDTLEDATDRGGLARTIGTEKTVDRSGRHVKRQVLDRECLPGAVVQPFDLDRVRHEVLTPISVSIACCSSTSETPARRASATSRRTSLTACFDRSFERRPGASSRTNVPAP